MLSYTSSKMYTRQYINQMSQNYSSWEQVKTLGHPNLLSSVVVRSEGKELIVDKTVRMTDMNSDYLWLEIDAMKDINSPHVVEYLGHKYHQHSDQVSIYMPYYRNGDLEEYLLSHKTLNFKQKINIFIDILTGMKQLHNRLIIHRDIKLKNMFVNWGGRCVVGDLGVAAVMQGMRHSKVGTFPNQAPEVYSNQNYDQKVDIWALGIIAYQLFNPLQDGKIPFPFDCKTQMKETIRSKARINYQNYLSYTEKVNTFEQSVPEDLAELITKMLQNRPEKRINWIDFYSCGLLDRYDEEGRLVGFLRDYQLMSETKQKLLQNRRYLKEMHSNYFDPLNRLLNQKDILSNIKKYPFVKKKIHELHIFFYLELTRALEAYDYIKERKVFFLIRQFKSNIEGYKSSRYSVEQRINIWLRENKDEEIANNKRLLEPTYYEKLKGIVDEVLEQVKQSITE